MYTLMTVDGDTLEVSQRFIEMNEFFKDLIDDLDCDSDTPIPVPGEADNIPNINLNLLTKIKDFCEYHKDDVYNHDRPADYSWKKTVSEWDKNFCLNLSLEERDSLANISLFFNNKYLKQVMCRYISHIITGVPNEKIPGLSANEIRAMFGVPPKEED